MYRALAVGLAVVIACATAGRDVTGDGTNGGDGKQADAFKFLDANGCVTQPCDIPSQCGCGSGACDIDGSDLMGTACRAITTPGHETTTCAGPSGCDKGYVCLGGTDASCHKYCGSNADCGSPRGMCVIDITNGSNVIQGIPPACSSNCDPANNANPVACPSTMKCAVFTTMHMGSNVAISDCDGAGTYTQPATGTGTSCKVGTTGDDTLCAANHSCTTVDAGATFFCRKYCTFPAGAGCPGAKACIHFAPALTLAGTEYGVCN